MLRFRMNTSHPVTGEPQQLPATISDFVARANAIIEEKLEPLSHEDITVVWDHFDNPNDAGCWVSLGLEFEGVRFDPRMMVFASNDELKLRSVLRELVSDFAEYMSRRIRGELRKLVREGA